MAYYSLEIGDNILADNLEYPFEDLKGTIVFFEEGSESITVLLKGSNVEKIINTSQIIALIREFKVLRIDENMGKILITLSRIDKVFHQSEKGNFVVRTYSETDTTLLVFDGDEELCKKISSNPENNFYIEISDFEPKSILFNGEPTVAYYPLD